MEATDWDARYAEAGLVWSAGPNQFVESICRSLAPGRAIDLAAGEGRNAVWLAERGWDVTAVDFSAVAVDKAEQTAARRGVTITAVRADLTTYQPTPAGYDLVLIAYLHVPEAQRRIVMSRAAAAVAPGGRLLVVGHDASNIDHGYGGPQAPEVLASPEELAADVADRLTIERAEVVDRIVETDDGPRVAKDSLVLARRNS